MQKVYKKLHNFVHYLADYTFLLEMKYKMFLYHLP